MKALLVDDQRLARVLLRKLLEAHPQVQVVAEADSVEAAERAIDAHAPDVIFLDIGLPGASGLDLLARRPIAAAVVFVTAYDQYAVQAFEVNALDYLLKPVDPARLAATIARLERRAPSSPPSRLDRFAVGDGRELRFVTAADLLAVRAQRDYTELALRDGRTVIVKVPLSVWADRLGHAFVRVHRSALVSVVDVTHLEKTEGSLHRVHLRGLAEPVPVGRRQLALVKQALARRAAR